MERGIERVRSWTRKVFPRRNEGYFIGAYISQYIDELMRDMGLPTRRARSFFSEYWGPLWGKRYREVAEERWRLREGRGVGVRTPRTLADRSGLARDSYGRSGS